MTWRQILLLFLIDTREGLFEYYRFPASILVRLWRWSNENQSRC